MNDYGWYEIDDCDAEAPGSNVTPCLRCKRDVAPSIALNGLCGGCVASVEAYAAAQAQAREQAAEMEAAA